MKNSRSNTLILGLMIPCLTFLFTSAPAPASGYVDDNCVSGMFGGFHVTEEDPVQIIMYKAGCDANVDITNNGPGKIAIVIFGPKGGRPKCYILDSGKSMVIGVEKGGGFGVGLYSGSHATGTYEVS